MKRKFNILISCIAIAVLSATTSDAYYVEFGEIPTPTPVVTPAPTSTTAPGAVVLPGFLGGPIFTLTPSPSTSPAASPSRTPAPVRTPAVSTSPTTLPRTSALPGTFVTPPSVESSPKSGEPASEVSEAITTAVSDITTGTTSAAQPIAAVAAFVALIATIVAAISLSQSGVSLLNVFAFMLQSSWEAVGIKRKSKVWGTVYDSRTKHGIPYAKVELLDTTNRVLEVRYADRDGRYGFLASPKGLNDKTLIVRIRPAMSAYIFPSVSLSAGITDFIVYDHIYTGGDLTITKDQLVNANVPMDPIAVSKAHTEYPRFIPAGRVISGGLNTMFWIGLVAAPLAYWMQPTTTNLLILIVFVLFNAVRALTSIYRPFGIIRDSRTGKPVSYALIELNEMTGKRVTFSVSDELGRYFLMTSAGTYTLQLHTPANTTPARTVSVPVSTRRGWISRGLRI